jgi:hypothetical protein
VVVAFHAETHALIPLYAVGVFISFTLSQGSMVVRWRRLREPGWRTGLPINLLGATTTGVVAVVIAATKFEHGAWMVILLIPILVMVVRGIHMHYQSVADQLVRPIPDAPIATAPEPMLIVPVPGLDRAVEHTISIAQAMTSKLVAIHVSVAENPEEGLQLQERWKQAVPGVPLVVLDSPYRSLIGPLLAYIDALRERDRETPVVVVLSEFVPTRFWEHFLHNQSALRLKAALFFRPNTVVIDVPYHLHR